MLRVRTNPRDIDSYVVTKPEMDVLGSTNFLTNLFINFTTLFGGAFLGSISGVAKTPGVIEWGVFYGTLGLAILFGAIAIICGVRAKITKNSITK